jgi:putative hydrolase of the HAD superfamily
MNKQGSPIIFVDADNTLWDTNQVYADAQLALLASVEAAVNSKAPEGDKLAYVRTFDQALMERHDDHSRYPPRLLVVSLALALTGTAWLDAVGSVLSTRVEENPLIETEVETIADQFFNALKARPLLRPGVSSGLAQLVASERRMVVLTEGSRTTVLENVDHYGFGKFFEDIIFTPSKDAAYFREKLQSFGTSGVGFMVGDQLGRDIIPARNAGLITIYFPGGFRPKWEPAADSVIPNFIIGDFSEVPRIVKQVIEGSD